MKRRMKRTTKQYIIVSFISIIIIGGAFTTIYLTTTNQIKRRYQKEIQYLSEQLESRKVYVYEAKTDIPAGSRVTKENLSYRQTYSNQAQSYYMNADCIGMVTLIDISKGTQVLKGMLTPNEIDNNLREVEYNTFHINSNIEENDYADIRILFPNGEDYIVLSKKSLKNLAEEKNNCFLWLTEEEILNMSGAIVDAYLYTGSKLYTAKYIEPNLQKPSIVTYQPSLASLILMEQDENIVNKASLELNKRLRIELEERLAAKPRNDNFDYEKMTQDNNAEMKDYFINEDLNYEETIENGKDSVKRGEFLTRKELQDREESVEYGE